MPLSRLTDQEASILNTEYNAFLHEIEKGQNYCLTLGRGYMILFGSLGTYALLSFNTLTDDKFFQMFAYGIAGIIFCFVLFILGTAYIFLYSKLKVERLKYWKAIHAVRLGWCEKTSLAPFLIFPSGNRGSSPTLRPRIRHRETRIVYAFGFINCLILPLTVYFLDIAVSGICMVEDFSAECLHLSIALSFHTVTAIIAWYPLICLRFKKEVLSASLATMDDMYPRIEYTSLSWRWTYRTIGALLFIIYSFHLLFWMASFFPYQVINSSYHSFLKLSDTLSILSIFKDHLGFHNIFFFFKPNTHYGYAIIALLLAVCHFGLLVLVKGRYLRKSYDKKLKSLLRAELKRSEMETDSNEEEKKE